MKKILIIFLLIIITPIFSTAEEEKNLDSKKTETISQPNFLYNNLKQKRNIELYKFEIEKTIKKEIPKTKKLIDKEFSNAQKAYKKYLNDNNKMRNIEEYVFLMQDYQRGIESYEVIFLSKLIDITAKYNNVENKIPATDYAGTLFDFLQPYFKENNINYEKYTELSEYVSIKISEIDNLIEKM